MILVQVPRGVARQVSVPDDVTDRSSEGALHFRGSSTKCLTEEEWAYLLKNEKELARKLRVVKKNALSRADAKAEHSKAARQEARKKQAAMPATKYAKADRKALAKPAAGKPPQKPQAGHRMTADGVVAKPSTEALRAAEEGPRPKSGGSSESKAKTKPKLADS